MKSPPKQLVDGLANDDRFFSGTDGIVLERTQFADEVTTWS